MNIMKAPKRTSRKNLAVGLSILQYEQVIRDMSKTTCRSISEYARKKILGKPLTVYYRNQSYDEFTEAYIEFKKDLDSILGKGALTEREKEWLNQRITIITETVVKLYNHVRDDRKERKHP